MFTAIQLSTEKQWLNETQKSFLLHIFVFFFGLNQAENTIVVYYWPRTNQQKCQLSLTYPTQFKVMFVSNQLAGAARLPAAGTNPRFSSWLWLLPWDCSLQTQTYLRMVPPKIFYFIFLYYGLIQFLAEANDSWKYVCVCRKAT